MNFRRVSVPTTGWCENPFSHPRSAGGLPTCGDALGAMPTRPGRVTGRRTGRRVGAEHSDRENASAGRVGLCLRAHTPARIPRPNPPNRGNPRQCPPHAARLILNP